MYYIYILPTVPHFVSVFTLDLWTAIGQLVLTDNNIFLIYHGNTQLLFTDKPAITERTCK